MNAFSRPTTPALFSAAERASARVKLQSAAKVAHMSRPAFHVFSPPITTRAQTDRTRRIRGR